MQSRARTARKRGAENTEAAADQFSWACFKRERTRRASSLPLGPLAAGSAYAAGAVILLARLFRNLRTGYVALGAFAGALPAISVHRNWHLQGSSPDLGHTLWPHVLGEGLLGLCVALVCLGLAAWIARPQTA